MYLDSALYRVGLLKVKTVIGLPFFYDKNQSTVCIWKVGRFIQSIYCALHAQWQAGC